MTGHTPGRVCVQQVAPKRLPNTFAEHSFKQGLFIFVIKINELDIENRAFKNFISNNKVFIEADFTKENILPIIEALQPFGIQITCKKEEKAGLSFVDEYAEVLEIIGF